MSLKTSLFSYLSTYAGLTALISTKIYPASKVPQGTTAPYCSFARPDSDRLYSHQGYSNLNDDSLQINCYSEMPLEADTIAYQITLAMEAWPAANSGIQAAFIKNIVSDLYDESTDLHFTAVEVSVTHSLGD